MPSQCRILSTCWNCYFLNLPSLACERCEKQGHLFKTFFLLKTFCLDHFFSRLDCAVFCFFVSLFILFVFFHSFSAFCFRMSLLFCFLIIFCVFLYFCFSIFVFLCFFHIFLVPSMVDRCFSVFLFFVFIYVLIPTCCGMGSSCCVYHC